VKLYPALFVFVLVRKRRWRTLAGLAVTGAALALLGGMGRRAAQPVAG
jgi:hypothetical protein